MKKFFCGSKKVWSAGSSVGIDQPTGAQFGCEGAELLGDFYFEKIKILLPKNASDF